MVQVGFTGTVANAVTEVKNRVCVVSDFNGGQGAVREIIEFILKAKGLWNDIIAEYLDPKSKQPKEPFYLAANKSNQSAPSSTSTPVRRPTPQLEPTQTSPSQRTATQPQQPAKVPQPSHAEQMKQLDDVGKKFNFKF